METRGENIQYQNCIHTHPYTHKHENTYKTTQQQIQTLYFRNAYTDTSTNKYIWPTNKTHTKKTHTYKYIYIYIYIYTNTQTDRNTSREKKNYKW